MGKAGLQLQLLLGVRLEVMKGVVVSAGGCLEVGCLEVGLVGHGLQLLGGLLCLVRLALTARGLVVALAGLCWWRRWVGQVWDCWWRRW